MIRKATIEDAEKILHFIKELAIYEKMEKDVTANLDLIREWIFEKKKANVIFVTDGEKEVGYALYFYNYSTFTGKAGIYLEDLFVLPEYRGKGYGKALLKKLAKIVVDRGYGRFEWTCLSWNKPSIDFYLSLGAKQKDWNVFHLTGDELRDLAND